MPEFITWDEAVNSLNEMEKREREKRFVNHQNASYLTCIDCKKWIGVVNDFVGKMKADKDYMSYKINVHHVNEQRFIRQMGCGKMAEFASHQYLTNIGVNVQPPDINIYGVGQKDWKPDLIGNPYSYEVRNHNIQDFENVSWISNNSDQKLTNNNGIKLILTSFSYPDLLCFVRWIGDYKDILTLLDEPEADVLKGKKKAIYFRKIMDKKIAKSSISEIKWD